MGGLSITHWLIVLLVVVLIFGARRLPDTARGLAHSLRIFKKEMSDEGKSPAQPRPQQPVEQGELATWPGLEAAGPASNAVPPRSTTPVAAPNKPESPPVASAQDDRTIVS